MDKKAIKTFSINARIKLREDIKYKMKLIGILEDNILKPSKKYTDREIYDIGEDNPKILYKKEIQQRNKIIKIIKEKGYGNVIEEIAYTIFNRLIAIRFMEINKYLPIKTRVLSSDTENKIEPDIITKAPNIDLNLNKKEIDRIYSLKTADKLDELFQFLFIKQCNELNNILPELFEKIEDFYELLFPLSFTQENGLVRELISSISEDNFKNQVEIIGWMYQYYNLELKEDTFKQLKNHVKISKERIPAATQMFTPDWIVKYMVENSLGKLWLENHLDDKLKENWKYYIDGNEENIDANEEDIGERKHYLVKEKQNIDEKKQSSELEKQLNSLKSDSKNIKLEEIKVIDPCMGSGHILVYVFDVLMDIYLSQGYNKKEATISILKNNIFGLDIDDMAYKLACFAVIMKARSYHKQIFKENIKLNLKSIQESNLLSQELIDYLSQRNNELKKNIEYIKEVFIDAKDYGSLLSIKDWDYEKIKDSVEEINEKLKDSVSETNEEIKKIKKSGIVESSSIDESNTITESSSIRKTGFSFEIEKYLIPLIEQAQILSQKYEVLVTNPPYMGGRGMNKELLDFLKTNYKENKNDLFSAFIEKSFYFLKEEGYASFLTPYVWMFISSYQKLRENIIKNRTLSSLIQFQYSAFEEATVPICAFTFKNSHEDKIGKYIKLSDFKGKMNVQETKTLDAITNPKCAYYFEFNQGDFLNIPGNPIAFWAEHEIIDIFKRAKKLSEIAEIRQGLATTDNKRFLRYWYEVNFNKIGFNHNRESAKKSAKKWFPYNKGGKYRKWYGNDEFIVNWQNDGEEIKKIVKEKYKNRSYAQDFTEEKWEKLIRVWVVKNIEFYFKESITWSFISSSYFSARYSPQGSVFDVAGSSMFPPKEKIKYLTGLMCSKVSASIMSILNPTINFQVGDLKNIPVFFNESYEKLIEKIVDENINISKEEWDYFEESWNFTSHPLIKYKVDGLIENSFNNWEQVAQNNFQKVKENEEKINEIFIDIYNLKDNLSPTLEDKDITIRKADLKRDIKSFISYFIGCLFGRYSLDEEGIIYGGGEYNQSNYHKFIPDKDNIVLILDNEYWGIEHEDNEYEDNEYLDSEHENSEHENSEHENSEHEDSEHEDSEHEDSEHEDSEHEDSEHENNKYLDNDYLDNDIVNKFIEFLKITFSEETLEENIEFIANVLGNKWKTPRDTIRKYFLNDFYKDHIKTYKKTPIYWLFDNGKRNGFKALIYIHRYTPDILEKLRNNYLNKTQKALKNSINKNEKMILNSKHQKEKRKLARSNIRLKKQLEEIIKYDEVLTIIATKQINLDLDDGVKANYSKFQGIESRNKKIDLLKKI
ncbi:MAG: BREX-1 system adenine-specific DNA-methyltransferase PglX [Methanobrevibacter sp.]|nr:BREX-1 system adenine-specific DNA-methyltransferase PglX [Methanobrevibacter sp.]